MDKERRLSHIRKAVADHSDGARLHRIHEELESGFEFIEQFGNIVTFFGSTRARPDSHHYELAREISSTLVKKLGVTVVTGGSSGIMEAANRGAKEAGGRSVGLTISLPNEPSTNSYLTDEQDFYYFFTRKVLLAYAAKAFVFLPGGYGTLDEFFEIVTLAQTDKIEPTPIIAVDGNFWRPVQDFSKDLLLEEFEAISPGDLSLFTIVNHPHEVVDIISEQLTETKAK